MPTLLTFNLRVILFALPGLYEALHEALRTEALREALRTEALREALRTEALHNNSAYDVLRTTFCVRRLYYGGSI